MTPEMIPQDHSRRTEIVGGYPVAITSYRLGTTYYATAEINLPGAGARIAQAEERSREGAERSVLAEARRLIEKKP